MGKKKHTQSGTTSFLACCLLILSIQACSSGSANSVKAPAPDTGITADGLRAKIKGSAKPYVLLNFFATWCKPCRKEMPELVALQKDASANIEVMLISIDSPADIKSELQDFLGDQGVDFPTFAVPENSGAFIAQFYTLWDGRIPLSLIYSREGRMVEALTGLTDRSEIELIVNMHSKMGS